MGSVLWGLVVILLIMWAVGLLTHLPFTAVLVIAAVILVAGNLLSGRRRAL